MYKVSWPTLYLGVFHKIVSDAELLPFLESLSALGFTGEVEIVE